MLTYSVDSLAEEMKDVGKETFYLRHPYPFLLLLEKPDEETDYLPPQTEETDIHLLKKKNQAGVISQLVVPLVKSNRNAFDSKIMVGRAKNNDIVLRAQKVSKLHCAFIKDENAHFRLMDMGSVNGTLVNGVSASKDNPVLLSDGDVIVLWRYVFKYRDLDGFTRLLTQKS